MSSTMKAAVISLFLIALAGCGGIQYTVQGQERAAGANGTIEVEQQEGGNFVVNIAVEHLLPPARFGDGLTAYVVWFQAPEQQPDRVGTLAYEEGDRRGEMMATTSHSNFTVVVTGEAEPQPVSPSENVVFRQAVETGE